MLPNNYKKVNSLVSQLRGILALEIESGWYTREKLAERLCRLCHCIVEDVIHFLCSCPTLSNTKSYHFSKLNMDVGKVIWSILLKFSCIYEI